MFHEESSWMREALASQAIAGPGRSVLDVGSSTFEFRTVVQPFIDANIFAPLRNAGCSVCHLDVKEGEGVDILCDLERLSSVQQEFDIVIASNVLEHARDERAVARDLVQLTKPGGYLLVTVPYHFVYHEDPIDTMFRPTTEQLSALLTGCVVVKSDVVVIRRLMLRRRLARLSQAVRGNGSLRLDGVMLLRLFKVSCVLARRGA